MRPYCQRRQNGWTGEYKMARKSYTRKVISQERDDYFSKLLADIKRYAQRIINLKKKGLLEKASTKIRPKVRHSKKRDGKPF